MELLEFNKLVLRTTSKIASPKATMRGFLRGKSPMADPPWGTHQQLVMGKESMLVMIQESML